MINSKKSSSTRRSGMLCRKVTPLEQVRVDKMTIGSYSHTDGAPEGAIDKAVNLSSEDGVVLTSRNQRRYRQWSVAEGAVCVGAYGKHIYRTQGRSFYYDDMPVTGMKLPLSEDTVRRFVHFDTYIVIMPDKYYYQPSTGRFGSLEATVSCVAQVFAETYEVYIPEELRSQGIDFTKDFREGDVVHLHLEYVPSQSTIPETHDVDITVEGKIYPHSIAFDPERFPVPYDAEWVRVTISRTMPVLSGMCVHDGRLFGYEGNTVYASQKGDVFNWLVLGTEEDDAYEYHTAHGQPFTACTVYRGKPTFFTEDTVSVLYGDSPSGYVLVDEPVWGVLEGSADSLLTIGTELYYVSSQGVTVYDGDETTVLSDALGVRIRSGVAGSDGRSYFLSAEVEEDGICCHRNVTYHGKTRLWMWEDDLPFLHFVCADQVLYGLQVDEERHRARLYAVGGNSSRVPASDLYEYGESGVLGIGRFGESILGNTEPLSVLEFSDCTRDTEKRMGYRSRLQRLLLRLEVGRASSVRVYLSCDGAPFRLVQRVLSTDKRCITIPVFPNRCHRYRIRIEATNQFKLYGIGRIYGGA